MTKVFLLHLEMK